jgi:hypothetical protein
MVTKSDSRISKYGFQVLVRTAPSMLNWTGEGQQQRHALTENAATLIENGNYVGALDAARLLGLYGEDVRRAFSDYLDPQTVEATIPLEPPARRPAQ